MGNKRAIFPVVLLVLVLAAFALGILSLFHLRFQAGDVYPPCSTHRADPLGARAFFESLGRIRGLSVERNYRPLERRFADAERERATLLCLGTNPFSLRSIPSEMAETLDSFVRRGGRLVMTTLATRDVHQSEFLNASRPAARKKAAQGSPSAEKPESGPRNPQEKGINTPPADCPPEDRPSREEDQPTTEPLFERRSFDEITSDSVWIPKVSLTKRWGYDLDSEVLLRKEMEKMRALRVDAVADAALPEEISWHSGAGFKDLDPAWRVRYAVDGTPVLIERDLGKGSLVLATDSFFHSNEALRDERSPALLAWLIGPNRMVVFDETHLGVMESGGVMVLARKYGLLRFLWALLFLAGLFVWKNASSLVPLSSGAHAQGADNEACTKGIESHRGFVNLLRRNIAPAQLLKVCFEEWEKSVGASGQRATPGDVARMKGILAVDMARAPGQEDPMRAYRDMTEVLAEKNRLTKKREGEKKA